MKTSDELKELLELLEAKENELQYNKMNAIFPLTGPYRLELYPKHAAFLAAGAHHQERAFLAANRTGKTLTGAFEMACHLTGLYPSWWKGKKFLNAVDAWAVGVSNQATKEIQQFELLGDISDLGSGMLPKNTIVRTTKKPGVADAIETIFVKHTSGGISKVTFKSYEQGRISFQGTKKQCVWLDEEPTDPGIYTECLTRLMDKFNPGIIYCTFTPLFGLSDVVLSFIPNGSFPVGGTTQKILRSS
jgi:phage terminase large subunit-like protein